MRYPPAIIEEIKARLPVSQVVARRVTLKKAGREYRGLSPFKIEKTPSFFVNDQKAAWFDFASGQNGDIFKFLMLTEGLTFVEAIERLAEEAGVPLPKPTERDAVFEDKRARLLALMEASAKFFEDRLAEPLGAEARRYVSEKRGLKQETQREFRLGFAPSSRSALKDHLARLGYTVDEMISSGMLIGGPDIEGPPYDRFRNRVMFPIPDLKGRVIAFGGRALEAGAPAKYLNSPETPLFHKGALLFNAARARSHAHDKGRVIAVEGYMDVVALAEAGFRESVAPLGTALTEDQVRLLWRLAPEPILSFDGDSAGQKAAFRAVETVLPHLKPGYSVRFAFLPDGLDPDDLIRQHGAAAMENVLAETKSLADMLWDREWASGEWTTPERRAKLDRQIESLLGRIADDAVRAHYRQDMRERLARAWGHGSSPAARAGQRPSSTSPAGFPPRSGPASAGRQPWRPPARTNPHDTPRGPAARFQPLGPPAASDALKSSPLVARTGLLPPRREAILVQTLITHPWLIEDHCERIAGLDLSFQPLRGVIGALLQLASNASGDIPLDSTSVRTQLSVLGFDKVVSLIERSVVHAADRFLRADAERGDVEAGWRHAVDLHEQHLGLTRQLEAAEREWQSEGSEDALARMTELQALRTRKADLEGIG
jgi:DNA primase